MEWTYKDKQINEISDLPEDVFGFIYQTTHTPTGKKYIGKKSLMYNLKKKLGKKEKALWEGKGRPPTFKRVLKESDWKTYYGSHSFIKDADNDNLTREIIHIAYNKKQLTYLECKYQFSLGVLEDSSYLNDNILGKFFDRDFK
ncbi:MAG: hypothetical protein HN564_09045 [Flavobacteriales bacterium]|jgi:hypothetical protein|nr:hypothetical protein [Flavobacteriales bacterium]